MNPMRIAWLFPLVAALAAVSLSGCSLGGGPRESSTIYAPDVRIQADPSWPTAQWQLMVMKPSAARMVDSPRIAVRPVPGELQVYRGASWALPATDLVEATILRAMEDSGRIPAVARAGTGIRADYKLVMDLRRFEADYAGSAMPSATIELAAKLLDNGDQRVVASRTFLRVEAADGVEVARVVVAFEQALAALASELVGWTLENGEAAHSHGQAPATVGASSPTAPGIPPRPPGNAGV